MRKLLIGLILLGPLSSFANCNIVIKEDSCSFLMKEQPNLVSTQICNYFYDNIEETMKELNFSIVTSDENASYAIQFGWSQRHKSFNPYIEITDRSLKSEILKSSPSREISGSSSSSLIGVTHLIENIKSSGILCK